MNKTDLEILRQMCDNLTDEEFDCAVDMCEFMCPPPDDEDEE